MILNFDKVLSPKLTIARQQILAALAPAGNLSARQSLMAAIATDYRNGALLAGVELPVFTGTVEIDLDEVSAPFATTDLLDAAVLATRRSPQTQTYLQAMEEDLASEIKGRRFVAACALLCFLLRE